MCLMEADGKGHLLIATLCFLTIVETGLNEMELRSLLIGEYNLLPIGIRRHFRNLPFGEVMDVFQTTLLLSEYCPDVFGATTCQQIPPLRWYYVMHRLGHILMKINADDNHFVIPAVCKRVAAKKYNCHSPNVSLFDIPRFLKQPNHTEHFKKHLRAFIDMTSSFEWSRHGEIGRFIR